MGLPFYENRQDSVGIFRVFFVPEGISVSPNGVERLSTNTAGDLRFHGTTSGIVTVKCAAAAGTWTLTLPTDDGAADQVLKTNGSGVTSWTDQTGGGGGGTVEGWTRHFLMMGA